MADCVFCRIIRGELPSFKLYEDEGFLAFLDIHPVARGHSLVIPKVHCVNLFDFDAALAPGYLEIIQAIAKRLTAKLGAKDFNVLNASGRAAQQSVDHLHFHVIPRFPNDGMGLWFHGRRKPSPEELEALAQEIRD
jgi:histidine triad (HIT) family protein